MEHYKNGGNIMFKTNPNIILETKNLSKNYAGLRANHNLNLVLEEGEIHALIGPNGAGKSTLIGQLSGELEPTSGSIFYQGRDITDLAVYDRAHAGISRSFQVTSVFDEFDVIDNLSLALQAHQKHSYRFWSPVKKDRQLNEQAFELARQFGLEAHQHSTAGELGHGEKRQLEIALTLAGDPKVLLLDEPMAGIGPGGSIQLTKLLNEFRGNYTVLLVEHDMDAVFALADRISVLVYGEIIATGTVEEIRNNEAVQEAYLGEAGSELL